jgi:hypothetical protein
MRMNVPAAPDHDRAAMLNTLPTRLRSRRMGHIMTLRIKCAAITLLVLLSISATRNNALDAQTTASTQSSATVVLNRTQAGALIPATVFFRGQNASVQARNSAGLRLPDGKLVLLAIVDTSGYSSAMQQSYQAYLITEVPLMFGGQKLSPGTYGFGFLAGDKATVMDIGGNELLQLATMRDAKLARPNPLQIVPDTTPGNFRLYLGRNYLTLSPLRK